MISVNGDTQSELIDVKYLKGKFRDAMGRIWPKVSDQRVPEKATAFPDAIVGFKDYLAMRGMKAFAVASDGAYGASSKHVDVEQAISQALQACQRLTKYADSCEVVAINQDIQGGSVELASTNAH